MGETPKSVRRSPLRWLRDKQRDKQARTGPSAEAINEQRSSEKVFDPHAVGKNAGKHFPPT